jgi:ribosomal protein S6
VKRYEGLFILDMAGKEDTIKDVIDLVAGEITAAGGKVETVQKMDKKNFARVSDKRRPAGFYVNIIFEGQPELIEALKHRFANEKHGVFRMQFTIAPAIIPAAPAAVA